MNFRIALVASALAFSWPQASVAQGTSQRQELGVTPAERALIGEPNWGLALSGGGLRASLVSLGALRALYEGNLLDSVQIISTVSGGSYIAYWLYSREFRAPSVPRFGARSLETPAFQVGVCDLATTGNFFTDTRAIRNLVSFSSVKAYDNALLRTFGQSDYDVAMSYTTGKFKDTVGLKIHDIASRSVRPPPYLIVNATVYDWGTKEPWQRDVFEFTPLHRGSTEYGKVPWVKGRSFPLRQAVAISGAAVEAVLKQRIESGLPSAKPQTLTLVDGGKSENLGAVALVRRRVRNIIIVDAGQDSKYDFSSYTDLKARIKVWGDSLYIDQIEQYLKFPSPRPRLAQGTYVGTIQSTRAGDSYRATVYYTKMSLPVSMDTVLNSPEYAKRGDADVDRVFMALRKGSRFPDNSWKCTNLDSMRVDLRGIAVEELSMYADQEQRGDHRLDIRSHDFPQYGTGFQSYVLDRSVAFVGLGYFLGSELTRKIKEQPHVPR